MDEKRLRKLADIPLQEQSDADLEKAGNVLGQLEQTVAREVKKWDKAESNLQKAYLKAFGANLVWSLIENRVEEWTGEDIEIVADEVNMSVEQFAQSNPKAILKKIGSDAIDEALERASDTELDDLLNLDFSDFRTHIKGTKI